MNSNILFKVVLQLTIMNEHIIMARRKAVIIKSKRTTVVKKKMKKGTTVAKIFNDFEFLMHARS